MKRHCKECGHEVSEKIKVEGYHWEVAEGYNFGHWVKDKKKKVIVREKDGKSK